MTLKSIKNTKKRSRKQGLILGPSILKSLKKFFKSMHYLPCPYAFIEDTKSIICYVRKVSECIAKVLMRDEEGELNCFVTEMPLVIEDALLDALESLAWENPLIFSEGPIPDSIKKIQKLRQEELKKETKEEEFKFAVYILPKELEKFGECIDCAYRKAVEAKTGKKFSQD
ncbi:MAG: hypothetical protein ACETVN_05420 [Asgard group archaeon]